MLGNVNRRQSTRMTGVLGMNNNGFGGLANWRRGFMFVP